jgi:HEAT repeat protein
MTDPRERIATTMPGTPVEAAAASFAPATGRISRGVEGAAAAGAGTDAAAAGGVAVVPAPVDEGAVATAVVDVLAAVARGTADRAAATRAADELQRALVPWLENSLFLAITVSPRGFVVARKPIHAAADIAAALVAAGVVAIVFKRGASAPALAAWVAAFADAVSTAPETLASRLWSVDNAAAGVRWRDEAAFEDGADLDEWIAAGGADAAGLEEHADLVRAFDAGPAPGTPAPATDWRRLVALTAAERERLRSETVESAAAAACRYGRSVAARAETGGDPGARAAAATALAHLVEVLVQQRRVTWLRELFTHVHPTAADVDAQWLQPVLDRLCAEHNVLVLGEILEDRAAAAADVEAVRDVLGRLPRAVEPLAALLASAEPARTRRLVCLTLAAVAASDPGLLVERAVGQTWYVVRNIAFVLGRIGDASVVPHLARWARHDDERVRIEVARALARVHAPGASDVLLGLLDDRDVRVRQCAVWSLSALEDRTVLPRLRQRLFDDREFRDRPSEERDDFFRTYGRLTDDAGFDELQQLATHRPRFAFGWAVELRRGAVLALGESGRAGADATLRALAASRDGRVRDAAQAALATLETGPRAPRLLDEDDWCEPARIGGDTSTEKRFRLEAEDA